jgi:chromate transporter
MRDSELLALIAILAPLSIASIGGAASVYAPLQYQTVDVQQWLTGQEFIDLFAIARVTPGPGTMLATLIGWKVAGLAGALVATLALFLPATVLCYAVARVWNRYRGKPWHAAFEQGLAPIGAGLLFAGVLAILRIGAGGPLSWVTAAGVAGLLVWRPTLHPFALLTMGAVLFLGFQAVTG